MRALAAALAFILPLSLLGQHEGHTMPPVKKPAVKKQAPKKQTPQKQTPRKQTAKKQIAKKTTTKKQAAPKRKVKTTKSSVATKKRADPHKGQGASPVKKATTKAPVKQPTKQAAPQQNHGGHGVTPAKPPATQPDPHQGHTPTTPPSSGKTLPVAPQPQHEEHGGTPPTTGSQRQPQGQNPVFPPPEIQPNLDRQGWPKPVMDEETYSFTLFERLEFLPSEGGGEFAWDVVSWRGGDYRRIWIKSEGEQAFVGDKEGEGDLEVHYGRLIKPFVDFLTGVRIEGAWGDGTQSRVSVGAGFQALAPYVVESEAFVYLSQSGQIYFNGSFSRDFYMTQRMVLQPRVETNIALNSDRRFGSSAGLQDLDLSLRLRYEIRREFAPYIGVSSRWLFGGTASDARARGKEASRYRFIVGLRTWF